MPVYAVTMLLAGFGIPILAALNSALGARIASPAAAAVILFCVALTASVLVLAVVGPAALLRAGNAPKHLFAGGLFVAFYVITVTYIAPKFGVGNAVFFVLLGQLASAALIDHFGLFGARLNPFTLTRATGIALMVAGVYVTQRV
jgi:transporter family-2 protein